MSPSGKTSDPGARVVEVLSTAGWRDVAAELRAKGVEFGGCEASLDCANALGRVAVEYFANDDALQLHVLDQSDLGFDFVLWPGKRLDATLAALAQVGAAISADNFRQQLANLVRACPEFQLISDGEQLDLDEEGLGELPDFSAGSRGAADPDGQERTGEQCKAVLSAAGWKEKDAFSFVLERTLNLWAVHDAESGTIELQVRTADFRNGITLSIPYDDALDDLLARLVKLGEAIDARNWAAQLGPIARDFEVDVLWELNWDERALRKTSG